MKTTLNFGCSLFYGSGTCIKNSTLLNLRAPSLLRFYRKSPKHNLKLDSNLHEIICGCMLGDLHAEKISLNHNTRLQFKYSIINQEYVLHLHGLFKDYTNGKDPFLLTRFDSRSDRNKTYSSLKFQTLNLPCFNIYKEIFYNEEGIKIIPLNIVELLTEKSLAYWLMDDGYKKDKGIYFCTESYTLEENKLLLEALKFKFSLDCGIHKSTNGYRLYVKSKSVKIFKDLTFSYILPLFHYKLPDV